MIKRINLNFTFSDKLYDKDTHDRIVTAVQNIKSCSSNSAHIWQNTIWIGDALNLMGALELGSGLQKQFPKKALSFTIEKTEYHIAEIRTRCTIEAEREYKLYVTQLAGSSLFGEEGLAPFNNLPKFFTEGTTITI